MLTLKTGVPGSGKTLTAVDELAKDLAKEKLRPVFVHGIPDLALPVLPLPVFAPVQSVKGGQAQMRNALEVDWSVVPDGALVVIDEAQHIFPIRGAGSAVPSYVGWLNTHRHRGIDIVLITQHPRLIDSAVRKLIGKHQHYRRLWGGNRHVRYEWDYCSEALANMDTASKSAAEFPKRAFKAYKSAEVHTKQSFSKPLWLALPVVAVVGLIFVGPKAYDALSGSMNGKGVGSKSAAAAAAASAPGLPASTVAQAVGRTAIPVDARVNAVKTFPAILGGCWITTDDCKCITNEVRPRVLTDLGKLCVQVAKGELGPDPSRPLPERRTPEPGMLEAAARPASAPAVPTLGI